MQFIHKIYMVLALLVLTLLGLVFVPILMSQDSSSQLKATEEMTQSAYPGIHIATEVVEDPRYYIAVHYPGFKQESLNKEINKYVDEETALFLEDVHDQKDILIDRNWQADFYLTFDIYALYNGVYALVFSSDSYVAGANGRQTSKVFMVDLEEEEYILGKEIVKDSQDTRKAIYEGLKAELDASSAYKDMYFNDMLEEWIEETDFSNLYLKKDALVFTFDKYEIAAGAAGSPEITLPLEAMAHVLDNRWVSRLQLDTEAKETETDVTENVTPDDATINQGDETSETADDAVSTAQHVVALTFDDGPHPENTLKALQLLEKYQMKATFFMLGSRIDFYPDLVKEVSNRGHEIGNHTWNHKQLTKINDATIQEEINLVDKKLQEIIGQPSTVFRPPYGATNGHVESFLNVPSVLWTIDTLDWKTKNPEAILAEVKTGLKPGAIILMHDIHGTTIEALELILPYLKEQGYTSVHVSDVLELNK